MFLAFPLGSIIAIDLNMNAIVFDDSEYQLRVTNHIFIILCIFTLDSTMLRLIYCTILLPI